MFSFKEWSLRWKAQKTKHEKHKQRKHRKQLSYRSAFNNHPGVKSPWGENYFNESNYSMNIANIANIANPRRNLRATSRQPPGNLLGPGLSVICWWFGVQHYQRQWTRSLLHKIQAWFHDPSLQENYHKTKHFQFRDNRSNEGQALGRTTWRGTVERSFKTFIQTESTSRCYLMKNIWCYTKKT